MYTAQSWTGRPLIFVFFNMKIYWKSYSLLFLIPSWVDFKQTWNRFLNRAPACLQLVFITFCLLHGCKAGGSGFLTECKISHPRWRWTLCETRWKPWSPVLTTSTRKCGTWYLSHCQRHLFAGMNSSRQRRTTWFSTESQTTLARTKFRCKAASP